MPTLNAAAPDFSLHANKEKKFGPSDFKGLTLILAFFPGAFTGVCTKEACALRDAEAALNEFDVAVLGVCVDSIFAIGAWVEKNDLSFPVVSDFDRVAIRAYDVVHEGFAVPGYVAAKRSVFILDGEGVLRWSWVAPSPGTEPDYEAIKAAVAAINA